MQLTCLTASIRGSCVGMDYYNLSVFEFVTEELGSQGTICAGGRYDGLIQQIGGKPAPAVGWALGVERILELLKSQDLLPAAAAPDVYVVVPTAQAAQTAAVVCRALRAVGAKVHMHAGTADGQGSMKSQFKRADGSGATWAVILGEDELAAGGVAVKHLRGEPGRTSNRRFDAARSLVASPTISGWVQLRWRCGPTA